MLRFVLNTLGMGHKTAGRGAAPAGQDIPEGDGTMKMIQRFRGVFGPNNTDMNDSMIYTSSESEVRTAMKDGIRRSSGMVKFAHLALVAVFTMVFGIVGNAEAVVNVLSSATAVDGTSTNFTAPNGTDRVIVAYCTGDGPTASGVTIGGSGATLIGQNTTNTNNIVSAWYRIIGDGSGENMNVAGCAAGGNETVSAVAFGGVDQTNPVLDWAFTDDGGGWVGTFPSIDVADGGRAAYIANANSDNGVDNTFDPPTNGGSWTELFDFGAASNRVTAGYRDATTAIVGLSVDVNTTSGATNRSSLVAFSLQPPACSDTNGSAITLTDPTNGATVSGSISITTSLTNAATAEYSIDGGAWTPIATLWNTQNTHPGSTSAPVNGVTVDVRAIEDECGGYVTDSITVTVDNTCTESIQSSVIWNGTSSAAGDFLGASFVTLTDVNTMEYQVTEGSGPGSPFTDELEYFDTADDVCDYSNWTNSKESTGNCGGTFDMGTTGDFLYVWNTAMGQDGTNSNGTGPNAADSGNQATTGGYLFLENSGSPPYTDTYFTRNTSFDATTYQANISFASSVYVADNTSVLQFQVNDGGGWTTEWEQVGDDGNTGGWDAIDINLYAGTVSVNGGASVSTSTVGGTGTAYTSGSLDYRFVFVSGDTWTGDIGLDTIRVYGPAQASETTLIPWTADPINASGVLTDGNTYNLYARGLDNECGVAYYGDSVANDVSPGTPTTFDWTACTETLTLTAPSIVSIGGPTAVTATGSAANIEVSWSTDGGSSWSSWVANGSVYTPPSCSTGNVIFRARGDGSCGVLNDQAAATAFDTTDTDVATLTTTAPTDGATVTGTVTIQAQVGVEAQPSTMTAMQVSIDGGAWQAMTWNGGTARWEYSWDTTTVSGSDIGIVAQTIDVRGTDPDCGDNVTATQISVDVDNTCSDATPSTITIPGGQTVGGSTVDIDALYSASAGTNLTIDSVTINGAPVSTPWDSTAFGQTVPVDVTLEVTGTDSDCGDVIVQSNTISVDNSCTQADPTYTVDQTIGYTGAGASIDYTIEILNRDSAGCGATTFDVSVAESGDTGAFTLPSTITGSPVAINGGAVGTVTLTVTADAGAADWSNLVSTVSVNSQEPAHTDPADRDVTTKVYLFDAMLHNSASTGSTKHSGSWGTSEPGAYGGEFTCETCHTDTTTNIKRIRETITTPLGDRAVVFSDTKDGSSDYAASPDNHSTSSAVCEVCHSYDATQANGSKHHAFDMSGSSAADQDHYTGLDCMNCHNHKQGFKAAGCTACHGAPPEVDSLGAPGLANLPSNAITGSTTSGAHPTHVARLGGFDTETADDTACTTCHNGYQMPDGGNIDINFNAYGVTTGSYGGQASATYNGGAGDDTLACSNTYCHGSTIDSVPVSPAWNGSVSCGDCHGATAIDPPEGTSHATHVGNLGRACSDCHGGSAGGAGHVDGDVSWNVNDLPNTGSTATYFGTIAGNTGNTAPSAAYGTCANVSCHYGNETPVWNTAGGTDCASCHGQGINIPWPDLGAHNAHFAALGIATLNAASEVTVRAQCNACHNGGTHEGTIEVALSGYDAQTGGPATWNGSTCSAVSCHGGKLTPAWASGAIDADTACLSCHTVQATPNQYNSATSGLHAVTGAVSGMSHWDNITGGCLGCHAGQPSQHFGNTLTTTALDRPVTGDFVSGITVNATAAEDTCAVACHLEGRTAPRSGSTPWARLNDGAKATAGDSSQCETCHGVWGSWRGNILVDHTANWDGDGNPNEVQPNHEVCETCHGFSPGGANTNYDGTWGTGNHGDGIITMNGPTPSTGAGYNSVNWGCDNACHVGGSPADHGMADSAWDTGFGDFGAGSCDACHGPGGSGPTVVWPAGDSGFTGEGYGAHLKVTGTDAFSGSTDWTAQCGACHGFHAGDITIPNNPTVGIDYQTNGGIHLGGTATLASPGSEAEICWDCHNGEIDGEFGVNNKANTGSINYDYGTLNGANGNVNWIGANWSSGVAKFGYKDGTIQSVHTANPQSLGGPSSNTGDTVDQIRCSYCHDVHNTAFIADAAVAAQNGTPYLRGTWRGNPYPEDGAPQAGDSWTTNVFGAVPRGTNAANELGGFQIDQNNGNPTNGWSADTSAGLCELCHGSGDGTFTAGEIDTLNQFGTASTDWVGTNGHSASVLGGGDSVAANIFSINDRNSNPPTFINDDSDFNSSGGNPAMAYQQVSVGSTGNRGFGFRSSNSEPDGWNLAPRTTTDRAHDSYNWGADTNNALNSNYHNFSCSKCHNPHASRLPRLMITNCLDTRHNTWDDQGSVATIPSAGTQNQDRSSTVSTDNGNVTFAVSTSAQNCHRVADPNYPQSRGAGWNNVTPW